MAFDAKEDHPAFAHGPAEERPAMPPKPAAAARAPGSLGKRLIVTALILAAAGFGGWRGYGYWTAGRFMESTDDAYLAADITELSPEVTGHVAEVAVAENQRVSKGDILFRLDDGDYRIALEQAQTQIATHEQTLKRIDAQIRSAQAAVAQAEAALRSAEATRRNAETTAGRIRNLNSSSYASQSQLDDANAALEEAQAQSASAQAQVNSAQANVAVLQAQYAEEEAGSRTLQLAVDQAQRNLDRTVIRAPYDGVVANMAGEQGELVSPGKVLAAVVPARALYVEANFKETQLSGIHPGAVARVGFDVLPGATVEGHVVSIAPATGAVFSLLPPENATGNFTKIVQRVPVRIALPPEALANPRLRAGLSAMIEVDTRTGDHGGTIDLAAAPVRPQTPTPAGPAAAH